MDAFAALFSHFTPTARAFFIGNLCTRVEFDDAEARGHLHVFRGGVLRVTQGGGESLVLTEPSLIFAPRHIVHDFAPDPVRGADLVCATIEIGGAAGNPIAAALPDFLVLPIDAMTTVAPTLGLLFDEAFATRSGRQMALDRLFEYLLIQVFRHLVDNSIMSIGIVAALADPRLTLAVTAMHERPERPWSLEDLANTAGMSRTRFAAQFRAVTGTTPADYLAHWRMAVAQGLLRKGKSVKAVATAVGYDSPAALTRSFARIVGASPSAWLKSAETPRAR